MRVSVRCGNVLDKRGDLYSRGTGVGQVQDGRKFRSRSEFGRYSGSDRVDISVVRTMRTRETNGRRGDELSIGGSRSGSRVSGRAPTYTSICYVRDPKWSRPLPLTATVSRLGLVSRG